MVMDHTRIVKVDGVFDIGPARGLWIDFHGRPDAERDALIARLTRPSGWQPIASAPKDGTQIIVCVGLGIWQSIAAAYWKGAVTFYPDSMQCDEPAGWAWCSDGRRGSRINAEPSAWMPLPAPPETGR